MKIFKRYIVFSLILIIAISMFACTGNTGEKGLDGKSAYEIWLGQGNEGTEADFLEWLKGKPGKPGDPGTNGKDGAAWLTGMDEPVSSLGKDGDFYINIDTFDIFLKGEGNWSKIGNITGGKGESAYEIYIKYNPEYEGGEEQWIEDLVGGLLPVPTYNITYHLNGGTGVSNRTYTVRDEIIALPTPAYAGRWFEGWYDNAEFEGKPIRHNPVRNEFPTPIIPAGSKGDKEFWAKWGLRKTTGWVFEAEYIDLRGLMGTGGWSELVNEWRMVSGRGPELTPKASNGYYLTYFDSPWTTFTFDFISDKAFDGALSFGLVSPYGDNFPMEPKNVQLHINGVEINYMPLAIAGEMRPTEDFKEYKFSTAISTTMHFKAGRNTVSLTVTLNGLFPDRPNNYISAAPNIDYMKITTDAYLVFNSYIDNNKDLIALGGGSL